MKKSSVVSLTFVICLLTLCITTLIVIYATAPETAVVLLEENFNSVDENKWTHEAAECKEDKENFYYTSANVENRYAADGTLHFFANHTGNEQRTKRGTPSKCYSCINWQKGGVDCFQSKYSARFRTKTSFSVKCGEIEVRSRLPTDHRIKLSFLIVPANNESESESESEEALGGFSMSKTTEETSGNCSTNVDIFFGPDSNLTVIKSPVTDGDFHLYKIQWDNSKIFFTLDGQIIFEKAYQTRANISCSDEELDQNSPINQPFYLKMEVNMGESELHCHSDHSDHKRSVNDFTSHSTTLNVDYIRFSKLLT